MPQVDSNLRKNRAKELRLQCQKNTRLWMKKQIGSYANVLMESSTSGHCEYFSNVKTKTKFPKGSIQKLKINGIKDTFLEGVLTENKKDRYELV
jgi:tRNA A37 methylthiotransferase MiaB